MKVKFSVIPFIPVAIVMTVFKLMSIFGLDESGCFLGMNKMDINYAVIGIGLGLFLLCVLINIFDRKTAPVYPVKKNLVSGILAILSGAVIMGGSITTLLSTPLGSEYYITTLICAAVSVFAGIAFIVMSKAHFIGKSVISKISGIFLFPALWGCSELVCEFLKATKVSISATDMTPLFCYIFTALYFFSHSMIVSRIKGRNSVKACFIYGLPAAALSTAYGVYNIVTSVIEGSGSSQLVLGMQFLVPALYMVSFIVEMAFNTYTKDEIEIIDGLPHDGDHSSSSYINTEVYEDLVFARRVEPVETKEEPEVNFVDNLNVLDDFVLGYDRDAGKEPLPYIAKDDFVKPENDYTEMDLAFPQNRTHEISEEDRLSEIDKLLQELENKK